MTNTTIPQAAPIGLPKYINLERAAKICGLSEQEIIDLAALGELTAGLIVPNWLGHAIPAKGRKIQCNVSDYRSSGGDLVASKYLVTSENMPSHEVDVFMVWNYWEIAGEIKQLVQPNATCEINFLRPKKNNDINIEKHLMPWDESIIFLDESQMITRDDLRFVLSEIESLGQPATDETKPETIKQSATPQNDWVSKSRELYAELKKDFPNLNKNQLSEKIAKTLAKEGFSGRGKKPLTAANIARHALQNT